MSYSISDRSLGEAVEVRLPTEYGDFRLVGFENSGVNGSHLALVRGQVDPASEILVRIHSECITGDVFSSARCDCGDQLRAALAQIAEVGSGILLYLRQEGRGIGLLNKLRAYELQDDGLDTVEANEALGFEVDEREYSVAIEMLERLGAKKIRLMTNNPDKIEAVERSSIELTARVPLVASPSQENSVYLETKRLRMGHLLETTR